jgi:site-specific recombinase XerD
MTNPNGWTGGTGETITYLNDEEVMAFFKAIEQAKDQLIRRRDLCLFSLMLAYGLRCAEVPLIQLEHVRLKEYPAKSELYTTRVKKKKDKKTGLAKPRDGRWYLLSDKNKLLLADWLKARKKFKTAATSNNLFITEMTGSFSTPHIYDSVVKYGLQAGLKLHPHMFRHTTAIRMARKGLSAFEIKERLGHVSVLSSEVYVQLAGPERQAADRRADEALEGSDNEY